MEAAFPLLSPSRAEAASTILNFSGGSFGGGAYDAASTSAPFSHLNERQLLGDTVLEDDDDDDMEDGKPFGVRACPMM